MYSTIFINRIEKELEETFKARVLCFLETRITIMKADAYLAYKIHHLKHPSSKRLAVFLEL